MIQGANNMKVLITLIGLMLAGCDGLNREITAPPGSALKPRITREEIVAAGGQCNEVGVCRDVRTHTTYDCYVGFYCVPERVTKK
jgi:hypothetical protein